MHNDAVVQGLSECLNMDDVERWGVFTIGTGLGNARFTNRMSDRRSRYTLRFVWDYPDLPRLGHLLELETENCE